MLFVGVGEWYVCRLGRQETDDRGRVYAWEGFTSAKLSVLKCPVPCVGIKAVSLGRSHGALLTMNGQLFMFGNNDRGQVGVGSDSSIVAVPRLLNLSTGTHSAD